MKNLLLLVSCLIGFSSARAEEQPSIAKTTNQRLITITSEEDPDKKSYLGVVVGENHTLQHIYSYGTDGNYEAYTFAQLSKVTSVYSKLGKDIILLKTENVSSTKATLKVIYNRDIWSKVKNSNTVTLTLQIRYNASLSKYELVNSNQRVVTEGHATTRRNEMGFKAGIDEFITQ